MLSPVDFIARWGKKDVPLVRFPRKTVEGLALTEEDKEFLVRAGLPEDAAPFLAFEAPASGELPTVADEWDQSDEFRRYRILGFNGSGDPIALDEDRRGEVVCLNHDDNFARVLLNSSVRQLAESLLAYRKMGQDAVARNGETALLEGNIPPEVRKELERALKQIDAAALKPGCFWVEELRALQASAS
jgi:hypothetical protein